MNIYLTEFIGTLFFVFVILYTGNALAIGAALAVAVMIGNGDYNPAVTIANMVGGKYKINDAIAIILIQVGGALVAYELVKRVFRRGT
jgi:glycerol uptake facilitator-like aquaporin